MVEIAKYEKRGDLAVHFERTKKTERAQAEAERMSDTVRCDVPRLTWEEYVGGRPCPGCGLPYRDDEYWEPKGTMYFTQEERARYEAEATRFKRGHPDCGSHRHSVSGSRTMHCGKCCPPPPLSPEQIDSLRAMLNRPKAPQELMQWRLRLYCGHVTLRTAHCTHKTVHGAFMGSISCPECGMDPATIVDAEAVGLLARPDQAETPDRPIRERKPTRAQLETRVRELEAELARLRDG